MRWTQIGGPPVALLSDRTQTISFEPPAAGTYTFRVQFTDSSGAAQSATVDVNAVASSRPGGVVLRVDHSVRKGGKVSLRAWPPLAAGETQTWEQIAGPPVVLDTTDPNRVLFIAPDVSVDTLLGFRVTRRTAAGETDGDDALVLVENYAQAPDDSVPHVFSGAHVSRVYPYKATSPFAADLVRCTFDAALRWTGPGKNTCTLATLPFLHQTTGGAEPSVAQIMDRVVVSHDWMGAVFEQFIAGADKADIRRLLNGVTAIVIGAQVRPSFYYALTGAIYLDADNFWLTPEQRDVISEAPDFRSGFDRDLAYSGVWRYTLANNNIFLPWPASSRLSRSVDYLLYEAGWLMYHELAHAGDFLPPATRGALNDAATVWDNLGPRVTNAQLPSDELARQYPLQSAEMRSLAQVKFLGAPATPTQRAYTPQQVAGFFAPDRATDEYNYSTTREDMAMLFEEFMMFHNHGIRRDVAITDKIGPTTTGDTLIVRWGQRGRVAETAVRPRVKLAVADLAPWIDANAVDAFPAPLAMRAGESWNANLVLPAPPGGVGPASVRAPTSKAEDAYLLERAQRRGRGGIPRLPGER
ncbi:MAG: PKD domain-containing protein [Burkholderiaceae bacterium]